MSVSSRTEATESSPLIAGQAARPNGFHRHHHSHDGRSAFVRRLLLDKKHTPGFDSDNRVARTTAHVLNITKAALYSSPVNVLLVFVPLGIAAGILEWSAAAVFTLNFFAIVPLAAVLSFATEEMSARMGEALGGLLNATFGNAVELIVSIVALKEGQIEVVQSSMLGSILSNALLVLGMCFFFGGICNMRDGSNVPMEQQFASATAQTSCSLMALSSASLIIPAALYASLSSNIDPDERQQVILVLSRGTSIILLLLYCLFLFFQLRTHSNLFDAESTPSDASAAHGDSDSDEAEPEEHMSPWSAAAVLVVVTIMVSICAEYLVDSIDAIVATGKLSKNFIGLILIPIVGNAAEHVAAVTVAVKNRMDLSMSVAMGSSIQIALLVTPSLVIVGWLVLDQAMTLRFESFETVVFGISVLLVAYTVQDGKSNYLEGAMLMGLYAIIALAFYVTPSNALDMVKTALSM
ncbi:calcium ion transporter [Grosmannia clavigera kw1407]|uniref:Vacuolar calcium ion transporter n=1 Tax=Grosmannia clavigera (strain kw1407 / UAMH 11150) TaxID=655863 RepID=F0XHN2_GROCL|nr:calcium ion transporter [Grosmannia clavigera kw1407]EFX02818.1 calcium ion transporter [Grosmannia clavigera kw1407]